GWQGIARDEGPAAGGAFLPRALAPALEHFGARIEPRCPRARPAGLDGTKRHVASAAREIEQPKHFGLARRIDRGNKRVLPGPVQPAGHQIVHEIVPPGDLAKHVVSGALLSRVVQRLKTES